VENDIMKTGVFEKSENPLIHDEPWGTAKLYTIKAQTSQRKKKSPSMYQPFYSLTG